MSTPPAVFQEHVDRLVLDYDVISPEDLEAPLPRRPLLFTFDDAYASVADVALPILKIHGVRSIIFLNTDPVFNRRAVFDNVWAVASSAGLVRDGDPALLQCGPGAAPSSPAQVTEMRKELLARLGTSESEFFEQHCRYLDAGDLSRLENEGWVIGGHTATHCRLRYLDRSSFRGEVVEPMAIAGNPKSIQCFAVPYGSSSDLLPWIRGELESSGVDWIFLTTGRANHHDQDRVFFRTTVQAESAGRLEVRLEYESVVKRAIAALRSGVRRMGWHLGLRDEVNAR